MKILNINKVGTIFFGKKMLRVNPIRKKMVLLPVCICH